VLNFVIIYPVIAAFFHLAGIEVAAGRPHIKSSVGATKTCQIESNSAHKSLT
jgi:hypothetical protein